MELKNFVLISGTQSWDHINKKMNAHGKIDVFTPSSSRQMKEKKKEESNAQWDENEKLNLMCFRTTQKG